jgi:hypothetical protein
MTNQIILDNQKSDNNVSIESESYVKTDNKNNLITIQSNKLLRNFYENDSQTCLFLEIKKKNFFESKKSLEDIPKNIFLNPKSRNKLTNKTYQIKSLNVNKTILNFI